MRFSNGVRLIDQAMFGGVWRSAVLWGLLVSCGIPWRSCGDDDGGVAVDGARWRAVYAPVDSPDHRKYAPDRHIDILHVSLDVVPDFERRMVAGKAAMRFKPIANPIEEVRLDAVKLSVTEVTGTVAVRSFHSTDDSLLIRFVEAIPAGQEVSVTVVYSAEPKEGLYFRTAAMGYPEGDDHLWTQGEPIESRHWFPSFDAPNEKFTSEMTCTVPSGMVVLSNGRKVAEERVDGGARVRVRWLQDKPHVTYLITLCAGYFKGLEDRYKDIPLAFYTPPSVFEDAVRSFEGTRGMMAYFEEEIGVPYPWAKYDQVCVHDFTMGGMENTSQTTLNVNTLFPKETENIRSSRGLVAHELAHQWFGDLVTCKDWSHIWLNEGFATYYAALQNGHENGPDAMLYSMYGNARQVLSVADDHLPIVHRGYDVPMEQFGYRAYPKGAWILHMLRHQLGEGLYRQCVRTFLERHAYGVVETEDLSRVIEELSGRSFDRFFDQYVYHAHHPELDVDYAWEESRGMARLTIRQVQTVSNNVMLFDVPLEVRFKVQGKPHDFKVRVREKSGDFSFPLPAAPQIARVDPNYGLLAKVRFTPPAPMLFAQLADKEDAIGRVMAIEQLGARRDRATVEKLEEALKRDEFYGVRIEASRMLRRIRSDEALAALLASRDQSDARVREQVVEDINGFYGPKVAESIESVLGREKNPDIVASALEGLGSYGGERARERLLAGLRTESFRNVQSDAAIRAIRGLDDPSYIGPVLDVLRSRKRGPSSGGLGNGLRVLGRLARNETDTGQVFEFLKGHLEDPREGVRLAAIDALGQLGDESALPLLATYRGADAANREKQAADRAAEAIERRRAPQDQLGGLRQEVMKLQDDNRQMRQELEGLKKKMEAAPPAAAEGGRSGARTNRRNR